MATSNDTGGCVWTMASGLADWERLARVGCWVWIRSGDAAEWSAEMFRITGRAEEAGAARYGDWEELCTADSWVRLAWALEQCVETGDPFQLELEFVHAGGRRVWGLLRAEAVRDERGEPVGVRGTLQDVTAWRETERTLRAARDEAEATARRKSEFLAGMSNGIRTPLNGIVGMTSLLMQTGMTAEQRDGVESVRGRARRCWRC